MSKTASPSLANSVGKGVAWSAINSFVLRASQFLMGVVVARLVSPHDFGVFVVALTVFAIVINVSEVGVSSALIRETDRSPELAPTVTTIALATSAVLALLMLIGAPWAASALGAPGATSSIRVLSLTVLLAGAGAVPAALMTRDFMQKQRFYVDFGFFMASNGVLLLLALGGAGPLALAWSRVAGQILSTGLLIFFTPERYWPKFDRREAGHLLRFGLPLAGANLIAFGVANADFIIIGRMKGALRLGYYNLAYNISGWPVSVFSAVLNGITLPTLSRVRHSKPDVELHLAAGASALAAAAFPVTALSVALAHPLINFVYGPRWSPAAVALIALALFGSVRVIIALLSDALVAVGRTRSLFTIQLIWLCTLVPTLWFGVHRWGIAGAGVAHTVVAATIIAPAYLFAMNRGEEGLSIRWVLPSIIYPAGGAVLAGLTAAFVSDRFDSPLLACLSGAVSGLLVYVAVLSWWLKALVQHLRALYGKSPSTLPTGEAPVADAFPTVTVPIPEPSVRP